jgi:hypothetical protein
MPLTEKRTHLANIIDKHVKQTLKNGGNDEDLLVSMYDFGLWINYHRENLILSQRIEMS